MDADLEGNYVVNQAKTTLSTTATQVFGPRADRCALLLCGAGNDTVTWTLGMAGTLAPIVLGPGQPAIQLTRDDWYDLLDLSVNAAGTVTTTVVGAVEVYPGIG